MCWLLGGMQGGGFGVFIVFCLKNGVILYIWEYVSNKSDLFNNQSEFLQKGNCQSISKQI